jgi:3-oxoadipate enol-lactonase
VRVSTHHTFSEPQLKVTVQGTGSPVVLSHALGLNLSMWDDLAAELAQNTKHAHTVLRYDHRGHGGSAVPVGPYAMDDLVDDAARLIREWGRGPVMWVGLSMGGMVGQGLAIRYPELISKLVLANTAAKYPEASLAAWAQRIAAVEAGGLDAIVNTVMERYFHAEFRATEMAVVDQARATVLRTSAAGYVAACHAVAGVDWLARLDLIKCPTLILAGALDVGAPVALSEAMASRIKDSKLVVMQKASHLSVMEQPEDFTRELTAFLAPSP